MTLGRADDDPVNGRVTLSVFLETEDCMIFEEHLGLDQVVVPLSEVKLVESREIKYEDGLLTVSEEVYQSLNLHEEVSDPETISDEEKDGEDILSPRTRKPPKRIRDESPEPGNNNLRPNQKKQKPAQGKKA